MENYYDWIKAIHIISMTAWMAGMFYLPRLYAYHADARLGSELYSTFCTMERRLLRVIMNPSLVVMIIAGSMLVHIYGYSGLGGWFIVKLFLKIILFGLHGMFAIYRKDFEKGKNIKSPRYYKIINELVTVMFVIIVIMVVVKPFDN